MDDCSTDNSKHIIEQYRNNKKLNTIIYNSENSGSTFQQWDKGIRVAKGEYIWIAESDDWCENNLLETLVTGIEKNKDVAFGYCQSFCVNDEQKIIFQSTYNKLEAYCNSNNFLENFLTFRNSVFNAGMAVFRKEFYYHVNDVYKSFKFTGDWIFWAELSRLGDVYINAKPLNYFRKHENDISGKMYKSGLNYLEEIKLLNYFHQHLNLSSALYFKAKINVYKRFRKQKNNISHVIKQQVKSLIFNKVPAFEKSYFLLRSLF